SSTAFNLGRLTGSQNSFADFNLHNSQDIDWYRFETGQHDGNLDINISSIHGGNLNLEIYQGNANGGVSRDEQGNRI
ncbi:hypothetical protein, partial [Limnospira indica]